MAERNGTMNGSVKFGEPVGVSGLRHQGGHLAEEFDRRLRTPQQRYATYQEMGTHPLIGVSLTMFSLLAAQVAWSFKPATDDVEGQRDAEFATEVLFHDMRVPWGESLKEILSAIRYGWSSLSICYKYRRGMNDRPREYSMYNDGNVGLDSLELRGQNTLERWEFDASGIATGWHQLDMSRGGRYWIPMESVVHLVTDPAKGNPEGTSMLRHCVTSYRDLKRWKEYLSIGISRDLGGMPVGSVPVEVVTDPANSAIYQAWKDLVRNLRRGEDEGAVIPLYLDEKGNVVSKLELLSAGGARQFDILEIMKYFDLQMLVALFTDILMIGHEQVGSLALHSSKTSFLSMAMGGILNLVSQVVNTQLMPRLWRLNGWQRPHPTLEHGDIESLNLADIGAFATSMAGAGFDVMRFEEQFWRLAGFQRDGE